MVPLAGLWCPRPQGRGHDPCDPPPLDPPLVLLILHIKFGLCHGIPKISDPVEAFCRGIHWICDPVFCLLCLFGHGTCLPSDEVSRRASPRRRRRQRRPAAAPGSRVHGLLRVTSGGRRCTCTAAWPGGHIRPRNRYTYIRTVLENGKNANISDGSYRSSFEPAYATTREKEKDNAPDDTRFYDLRVAGRRAATPADLVLGSRRPFIQLQLRGQWRTDSLTLEMPFSGELQTEAKPIPIKLQPQKPNTKSIFIFPRKYQYLTKFYIDRIQYSDKISRKYQEI